jgi:hypothetical protein
MMKALLLKAIKRILSALLWLVVGSISMPLFVIGVAIAFLGGMETIRSLAFSINLTTDSMTE